MILPATRRYPACLFGALLLGSAVPALAVPMPNGAASVSIIARDQPIAGFVRDLFGRVGQPVVVSSGVTGAINGTFTGSAAKVFSDVAKAFNLVGYYDGAALYVYAASELTVQTLPVGRATATRVIGQVQAQHIADARNMVRSSSDGTLVVSGTPRFVEQVGGLAQGGGARGSGLLGAPRLPYEASDGVQPLEFRVFYLRYARAEDTTMESGGREVRVPGMATIVQNLVLDRRSPSGNYGSYPIRQSATRLKGQGLDSIRPNVSQTPLLGLPVGGLYPSQPGMASAPPQPQPQGGGDDGAAAPLTADIVRVEANPMNNAVIVRDVPSRMAAYDSLIRALDVEPQMVELEATIVDINVDKLRQLGINWRLNTGGFGALFGNGTESDLRLSPTGATRSANTANILGSAAGGTISTIIGPQREFLSRITALESRGAARVVSRPGVMTLSNVEAVFDRTRTFYVRVAGREEVDLFNVTSGIVLRVNPHVFRDHDQTRIRMMINIEDGRLSPNSVVDNIPIVDRSSVSTQAMVLNGESLLLGGMTADEDADDVTRVPLLGEIPLLGNLFKTRSRQRAHIERLFLITPRLATLAAGTGPVTVSSTSEAAQAFTPKPPERTR